MNQHPDIILNNNSSIRLNYRGTLLTISTENEKFEFSSETSGVIELDESAKMQAFSDFHGILYTEQGK